MQKLDELRTFTLFIINAINVNERKLIKAITGRHSNYYNSKTTTKNAQAFFEWVGGKVKCFKDLGDLEG